MSKIAKFDKDLVSSLFLNDLNFANILTDGSDEFYNPDCFSINTNVHLKGDVSKLKRIDDGNIPIYLFMNGNNLFMTTEADEIEFDNISIKLLHYMESVQRIFINGANTEKVTDMQRVFEGNSNALIIECHFSDVSHVTTMEMMFLNCNKLETINIKGWNTASLVSTCGMFLDCQSLRQIEGIENMNMSHVTDASWMFSTCESLNELWLVPWDVSSLRNTSKMFNNCAALSKLYIREWNTEKLEIMTSMFENCHNLELISGIEDLDVRNVQTFNKTFSWCYDLTSLDLSKWDVRKAKDFYCMFLNCYSLKSVNIDGWKTSHANCMQGMFQGCVSLKYLDARNLRTSAFSNMSFMFDGCRSLKSIDVGHFSFRKCTDARYMFKECEKLSIIDTSKWRPASAFSMSCMFAGCPSLVFVDTSGWGIDVPDKLFG